MDLLIQNREGRIWFNRTTRPYEFIFPAAGESFAILLMVGDDDVTAEEQWRLSQEIVHQGCRYAVCAGHECGTWDDSIDMVCLAEEAVGGDPAPFVMTTWHEDESMFEVLDFFRLRTESDGWRPRNFIVLLIGGTAELEAELRAATTLCFSRASR